MQTENPPPTSAAENLLDKLLDVGLISHRALEALPGKSRVKLATYLHERQMLTRLVEFELLTAYQAERVRVGKIQGLILGNYRVLDRLGVGNDGVVFRGEHRETGHKVAIKVLIPKSRVDSESMMRFFAERKTVAQLCHPGIVQALDIGESTSDDPDEPVLYYYVMELVPGLDLEQHVQKNGPMQPSVACEVAYQVADALTLAQKHNLVHRDIKPSNILLTPEGRAMLLDFGLVRQFNSRQTIMGSIVGTLEWIAPEQRLDAHAVDIRADIYSLGCTLFWCLTGQSPHGMKEGPGTGLAALPRLLPRGRSVRNDISHELDDVVAHMMAPQPDSRYPTPQAVMAALSLFVSEKFAGLATSPERQAATKAPALFSATARVLIVDEDAAVRRLCCEALQIDGITCAESAAGALALTAVAEAKPDVVLIGLDPIGMAGLEVLKQLRAAPRGSERKFIMLIASGCAVSPLLAAGADDYLTKPIDGLQLSARVKTALRLKETQDAIPPPPVPPSAYPPLAPPPPPPPPTKTKWQAAVTWLAGPKKQ